MKRINIKRMPGLLEELHRPIWSKRNMIEGIISGGFISAGIVFWNPPINIPLIIIGILVFIDAIMIYEDDPHIVTTVIFSIISGIFMFIFNIYGFGLNYFTTVAVIAIVFLYFRLLHQNKK